MLPLWWEHNFEGSDPPKIDPESHSERHRREKLTKIASGAVSGRTFSLPRPFFVDFRVPAGSQKRPLQKLGRLLERAKIVFFAFSSLGRVPEGSRSDSGGSGDPPGPDFDKIFHKALRFFVPDSCRILRHFFDGCVGILSGFVGFRRGVAGICIQPQ